MEEESGTMSVEDIYQKISCWLPDVKRLHGFILKLSKKSFLCKVYRCTQEAVGPDLGGHRQVCGSSSQDHSIKTLRQRIQEEEKQNALPTSQMLPAMPPLEAVKVLVSTLVCWLVDER